MFERKKTNLTRYRSKGLNPSILPIAWIWLSSSAYPATYYVATNGRDGASGAFAAPFLSIQRGVDAARPGDTIIVRDGVYGPPGGSDPNSTMAVSVRSAGTASAPITLKAEHKWGAVLDCRLSCHSYVKFYDGAAFWILEGFDITGGYWSGVMGNTNANHITLRGNHFHHIGNRYETAPYGITGWYSHRASRYITFDGNMFNDIGRVGSGLRSNIDHGIYSHATNVTVINNIFYNLTRGWGIQTANGAANWLVANNTFAFANPGRDGHIALWDNNTNIIIRNNIFYNPRRYAIVTADFVGSCAIDHNIVYGASGVMADTTGCAIGGNQIGANPMFVNASTAPYDFHVRHSSPALGAGAPVSGVGGDFDGTARAHGSAYSIGAYESLSTHSSEKESPARRGR